MDTKAGDDKKPGLNWTAFLDPEGSQSRIRPIEEAGRPTVVISLPSFFRGQYSGQLMAWICPCSAYRLLDVRQDATRPAYHLAVENQVLPHRPDQKPPNLPRPLWNRERAPGVSLQVYKRSGNFSRGRAMLAGVRRIPGTPLDLITIQSETEVFGSRIERSMPLFLGLLGLVLVSGAGVIFWGNTRRLLLQTRLDTEAKSRAQIEGMNQQLEQRVKDRTTELERSYLQLQQKNEERLKAVEEQRVLEKRMARMIEAAPIGICIQQKEQLVYVNPACVRMFGYNQDQEMLGLQPADLIAPEGLEAILVPAKILPAEEGPAHYTIKGLKADGEQFEAVFWTTSIDYEGHKALLGFVVDVSEEERLRRQFIQAQKMEAVGRLAGGVAHDFNNLLTIILGCADQAMSELETDSPAYEDAQEIKQAGERAASLTRQLLAFSRKQVLRPEVLCLNQVLGNLQKMLRRLIGEDVELQADLAQDLEKIRVDQGQMEQVVLNLAINARDAMPDGGCLRMATANSSIDSAGNRFNGVQIPPGEYVRLELSDTGIGMDEQTRYRIFELFFTTKEQGKGTGLGLATVYGIVKQSQGFIFCNSQMEQGTTFSLYFPVVEEEPLADRAQPVQAGLRKGFETILLVEDDAGLRKIAERALKSKGYTVLSASNEQEVLAICEAQSGQIHLFLSDVVLPGMNGVELEQRVRARRPEIKKLFMSGYAGEALEEMDLSIARTCFLKKPFVPEELCRRVREVLDS